ncbi:MAG: hypothetical protein QGG48_10530, partial [Desulfatiglandales bacterium]|nr:hypothetical protein [Desulfatiglandales bacterium]
MNKDIFDFSLNDLKIEEHRDIEQELSKDPVLQAMYEKIYSTKIQEFCQFMLDQAFPIPRGISMKADQLCSRFKEHLPGDYGLELLTLGDMVPEPSNQQQTALARFFAGKHFAMIEEDPDSERSILKVCLGAEALQNRSEEELLFLMGHAAARVTDECPPYHLMLKMASPIGFDQQLLISRLLRFQTTTAACLGLMACRSLDAAKQSLFKLETGINPGLIGVDYDKLSDCQDGKMSERALIGLDYPAFTADPLYFYALEQLKKPLCEDWVIDETEWENYSKAISKANERFHPKLKEMPEEDRHFRERFKILCMHAV